MVRAEMLHTQRLACLGTMAGGMVHELRNLLTPLMTHAYLAEERLHPGHPVRENLAQIIHAAEQARDILQRLLVFSRREEFRRVPVQLGGAVENAVKMLRATFSTEIDVQCHLPVNAPVVLADPTEIGQLIVNLVLNSAQAMEAHGGVVDISIDSGTARPGEGETPRQLSPGDYACVAVRDNGPGMDPSVLGRVFEPFFTTKPADQGSGLGLWMARDIAQRHGGTITVESVPREGALFRVYFPVAPSPRRDHPAHESSPHPA